MGQEQVVRDWLKGLRVRKNAKNSSFLLVPKGPLDGWVIWQEGPDEFNDEPVFQLKFANEEAYQFDSLKDVADYLERWYEKRQKVRLDLNSKHVGIDAVLEDFQRLISK